MPERGHVCTGDHPRGNEDLHLHGLQVPARGERPERPVVHAAVALPRRDSRGKAQEARERGIDVKVMADKGHTMAGATAAMPERLDELRAAGIETWELDDVEIEVQNMVATYALHYPEDYNGTARMDDNHTRVIDVEGGIRAATDEEVEAEDPRIRGIREGEPLATMPRRLNLNNLTFHLPFDKVEYEPEQFPGLIYRLDYPRVVCLIFGSGKMVITGARDKSEILEAVQFIQDELADLL